MITGDQDTITMLKDYTPVIEKQSLDNDIEILGEEPIFQEKQKIMVDRGVDDIMNNKLLEGGYFEEIDKSNVTAKKFKNRIFLGTDGNYYKSKKNKKGDYVWVLVEKK